MPAFMVEHMPKPVKLSIRTANADPQYNSLSKPYCIFVRKTGAVNHTGSATHVSKSVL